jgi:hypothetical protein
MRRHRSILVSGRLIMANLRMKKSANFRILAGIFISAALAPAICAQAPRQLQVEVGPNQQVTILANNVSYGEVLRTLGRKLGWEIEIPALADELKLSYALIEGAQPQTALAKLLEGSRLGYYTFLSEGKRSRHMKVFIIPFSPREVSATQEEASNSPISENPATEVSPPLPAQEQATTTSQPNAAASETTFEPPPAPSSMPLADAINAIGVPPGVSPADVGRTMTFPISDAARIMGVPPGVSPDDVGKTKTMPLPTGPGKHP